MPLHPGPEWRIFCMSPLRVSYRSMTSRFLPFAFVELVSPYNKKNITRWLKDMNFMFSWQEQLQLEHKIHIFLPPCNILYLCNIYIIKCMQLCRNHTHFESILVVITDYESAFDAVYRGYYTVARRYEFYVRVARTIFHK